MANARTAYIFDLSWRECTVARARARVCVEGAVESQAELKKYLGAVP